MNSQNRRKQIHESKMGVSEALMVKLQKCGFDQNQLSNEELIQLQFKDWSTYYVEGIPLYECNENSLAEKFGVSPSDINIKPQTNYDTFGCCWIHYNDKERCKKMVYEINWNPMYLYGDRWKIRASNGLLKYCKKWVYGRYCNGKHDRFLHGVYHNFEEKEIHTKEMEKELKKLPCGPTKNAKSLRVTQNWRGKPQNWRMPQWWRKTELPTNDYKDEEMVYDTYPNDEDDGGAISNHQNEEEKEKNNSEESENDESYIFAKCRVSDVESWDVDMVADYVNYLFQHKQYDQHRDDYVAIFMTHDIDGEMFMKLERKQISQMGIITEKGKMHVSVIENAQRGIKQRSDT